MIIDHIRNLDEFEKLYRERPISLYSLEHIINNPYLFCFYGENDGALKGFIFITQDNDGKLYLSGVSVHKNMPDNINAIIKICDAFPGDMYSDTDFKPAVLVLKKAGFVKTSEQNIFVRYKNG